MILKRICTVENITSISDIHISKVTGPSNSKLKYVLVSNQRFKKTYSYFFYRVLTDVQKVISQYSLLTHAIFPLGNAKNKSFLCIRE